MIPDIGTITASAIRYAVCTQAISSVLADSPPWIWVKRAGNNLYVHYRPEQPGAHGQDADPVAPPRRPFRQSGGRRFRRRRRPDRGDFGRFAPGQRDPGESVAPQCIEEGHCPALMV